MGAMAKNLRLTLEFPREIEDLPLTVGKRAENGEITISTGPIFLNF